MVRKAFRTSLLCRPLTATPKSRGNWSWWISTVADGADGTGLRRPDGHSGAVQNVRLTGAPKLNMLGDDASNFISNPQSDGAIEGLVEY